jgi:hypothetical protein
MPKYRIYLLNNSGHILGPHHLVTCDTDQEIIGKAKSLMEGDDVEIWDWRVAKISSNIRAELATTPKLETSTVRHQRDPAAANPKQLPILAAHRLIAEFFNLLCGHAGATHGFDHMVDKAIVVA